MKKKILVSILLLLFVCSLSFNFSLNNTKVLAKTEEASVVTMSSEKSIENSVLNARFLNMLNHSFAYNDDFFDNEVLINNSTLALLNLTENGFIAEDYVSDYIFNMYGIKPSFDGINTDFEQKQGFVYVIPRGYEIYTHKIKTVTDNSDGSFTVVTDVEISLDDGSILNDTATTVFLKNSASQFGFNIVYSEIGKVVESVSGC